MNDSSGNHDLPALQRLVEELRAKEERFRALVENTSDLMSVIARDGTVLYQSPSGLRISGYDPEERIGRSAFELIHPEDIDAVCRRFADLVVEPGGQIQLEYRSRHQDGSWHVLESVMTNQLGNAAVRGVVSNTRDVTERKEAEARLLHEALHDALTGLPNRVLFLERLEHALDGSRRRGAGRCAVLFLDLDRFKMINDSFGHAVGDQLLVEAANRLRECLRPADTLGRLGGDEFAVLLETVHEPSDAVRVTRRILRMLETPFELDGREIFSSTSIGIALGDSEKRSPEDLLRDADTAMYRAKARGRGSFALFDARMHAEVIEALELEIALRRAVAEWQFELHYQPIFDLAGGTEPDLDSTVITEPEAGGDIIAGFETLLRWRHPERGLLLPEDFMTVAGETGLVNHLCHRVLVDACRQIGLWRELTRADLFVTVNISYRQLAQHDLVQQVAEALDAASLPGSALVLEITERAALERAQVVLPTMEALRDLGVGLALDNFGQGQSSLAVLHRFPFDHIKLDRYFVENLDQDHGSEQLVEGLLALCHWRRLTTMAQGVETEAERRRLVELGCRYGQGFLFAAAADADKVVDDLARAFPISLPEPS